MFLIHTKNQSTLCQQCLQNCDLGCKTGHSLLLASAHMTRVLVEYFILAPASKGTKKYIFCFLLHHHYSLTPSTSPVRATLSWVKESRQAYIINQTAGLIFDLLQCSITWGEPCRHGKTVWYSLKSPLWCTQSTHRLRFLMISSFKYMFTASFCLTVRKR